MRDSSQTRSARPDAWLHVGALCYASSDALSGWDNDSVRDFMRDVDRTLLRENPKLTPEQRLEKFENFMRFVAELRRPGENVRAQRQGKANLAMRWSFD